MALSVQVASVAQNVTAKPVGLADVGVALFWLIVIFIAAYCATKFIASKSLGLSKPSGTRKSGGLFSFGNVHHHVRILDRVSLSRDKALVVVVYQGKQYLLAVSENNITVIQKSNYKESENAGEPEHTKYQIPDNFITRFINKQNQTDNINKSGSFEEALKSAKKGKNKKGEGNE